MEENKNLEAIEEETEEVDVAPETYSLGNGSIGVIVGLCSIVGATVVGLAIKHRDKLDEWRIRKLEKKGYTVSKPVDVEIEDEDINEELE